MVNGVIEGLLALNARLAEPGEFTRRAFENGKLDLSQAEAVADLVDAETEAQRRQALEQLDGALSRRHAGWRGALTDALALLEAAVDFPDEDLPAAIADQAAHLLSAVLADLEAALADGARGERVRSGFRIAIVGAPNAGKSSLLNRLAERPAAIVAATPGTTRDIIETPLALGGYRVLLADTAGLRTALEPIEAEGVRRALDWADQAALRLLVVDGADPGEAWREATQAVRPGDVCVLNKADLPWRTSAAAWARDAGLEVASLSASTGAGLETLRRRLGERVAAALSGAEFPAATRARHRRDLTEARNRLSSALGGLRDAIGPELAAEDVRLAARALARIGGRIDPEEVLDRVFAQFCIGK